MRNKLIDLLTDISAMSTAGLSTFAKIGETADEHQMRTFIKNWTNQLEDRITSLRGLLETKPN